jgi:hypothetical protein
VGLVVCSLGGESWDGEEEEEEEIGEGDSWQSCDILTFADGITDRIILSVVPLAIMMVNWSRHCTEISV